ncbi:MAG: hypothetical protein IJA82_03130 [Clostridia bacterium]|nr:hypothetical protein [Clostridia bacterium]
MSSIYEPINSEFSSHLRRFYLIPELWEKFNISDLGAIDFSKWKMVKMMNDDGEISEDTKKIPTAHGGIYIYTILPPVVPQCGGYIMYVGMASKTSSENLRSRVRSYKSQFGDSYTRDRIHNLFANWGKYVYVYYLPVAADEKVILELETRLIGCLIPPCNSDIRDVAVKKRVKAFAEF